MPVKYVKYDEHVTKYYTVQHARLGYYISFYTGTLEGDRYVRKDGGIWSFMDSVGSGEGGTYFETQEEAESLLASLLGAQK